MKYNLPRGYLSYSSMHLWNSSKVQFRNKYYSTESFEIDTPFTRFGKEVAELLEDKKKTKLHPVLSQIPMYPVREQEFQIEVADVPLKGFIDSFDKRYKRIIEIKTGILKDGEPPWDNIKVRKHEQIRLYSMVVKEMFGSVHPVVKLIWLETCWKELCEVTHFNDKEYKQCKPELALTGNFKIFERVIEDWEHEYMKKEIVRIASEISEDYTRYQQYST